MPFFDFLDDTGKPITDEDLWKNYFPNRKKQPAQIPTISPEEESRILGESGRPVTQWNVMDETEAAKRRLPDAQVAGLQKRNKLESDVKNKALKLVQEEFGKKYGLKQGESLAFGGEDEESFTRPIYQQGLGGISRVTRAALQRLGIQPNSSIQARVSELEELESQGLRAQETTPPVPYAPGSGKLEAATKTVGQMDDALKYAVTAEQKNRLMQQRQQAMGVLDPGGKIAETQAGKAIELPSSQTILGAAKTAGIPEKDFQAGIAETAKKMGLNLDEEVEFPLALQRLLNSPEFADVRPDFEALGSQPTPPVPGAGQMAEAGKAGQQAAQPPVDLHAEERAILTKMANEQRWTWYEAIAFVLLSMVLKPAATLMLWNRQANAGARKAELIENRRKQKAEEMARQEQMALAKENRARAAKLQSDVAMEGFRQYGAEKRQHDEFRQRWAELVFKTANTRQRAQEDPELKLMQKDVDMYLDFAAKAAQNMETKKANEYLQRAENAMNLMLKYRAGDLQEQP